jgi:hypothetical protein
MPAKAGIRNYLKTQDSRLRGKDLKGSIKNLCSTINIKIPDLFRPALAQSLSNNTLSSVRAMPIRMLVIFAL